jgi:rod shape-determining protein MreD
MKPFVYSSIGITVLWLQLTVAPLVAVFGYKPNLLLLSVVVIGLRWLEPWLFFYAACAGLALDVFSHGVVGVYALSFFAASFLARYIGTAVYENSLLVGVAGVLAVSLAEGLVSVSLFEVLDATIPWWRWTFTQVLPNSIVNAVWSPLVFLVFARLERWVHLAEVPR